MLIVHCSLITDYQPSTINHQPSTINHQLLTINHQPSTINHQPSTINHQPSTKCYDNYRRKNQINCSRKRRAKKREGGGSFY
ncbi:MAG: hypothetical protein DSM107014_15685 [Gomphosphaeria aponina SAG 52.96 = DSM 107014]|uniref:Uncharacterized protein n=1 Tax=Gomphosphaeria aponina SAG 52.96 = DSM 107014 TaxID=1521640 RepID=A0A941GS13_9CHRO|nr:hypothetical protein [Gomphosphaeria aponina SAG 52.96 = DSM 107014]